jgi:hypothetical protein
MAAASETVDVWVGRIESESRFVSYLEEQYENDDLPINEFCADMGAMYYDHDGIEAEYYGDEPVAVDEVLADCSWSSSYSALAIAAYQLRRADIGSVNTTILLFDAVFQAPRDAHRDGVALYYLGRFSYKVDKV